MIPAWAVAFPWQAISLAAGKHGLDPLLVAAFVAEESGGIAGKSRHEPKYRWLCKPEVYAASLGITADTETVAQMHSYGLMQIMGATARSLGYNGYLAELIYPDRALDWGCAFLATLKAKYGADPRKMAAAYNAGHLEYEDDGSFSDEAYVDGVIGKWRDLGGLAGNYAAQ